MEPAASSQQARTSFDANGWARAYEQYSQAAASGPLTGDDLERFALSASLTGRADDAVAIRTRAHQEFLRQGDAARGARCAFWLAFGFLNTGDMTSGMAWLGRAESLLENVPDCVERGYLRIPAAIQLIDEDPAAAYEEFREAARIADRFDDNDLRAMASLGSGKALIQLGRPRDATLRLDQAMLAVTANEVSPVLAGDVYCAVIEACQQELFDLRRAREWTAALTRWCESQPDMVPFRGQCLVYRAELSGFAGDWPRALAEVEEACEHLTQPRTHPAAGSAFYQLGELHRVRGDFARAEAAYRQAHQLGHSPYPGFALLRLAQGDTDVAATSIRREVDEAGAGARRGHLLGALVEIAIAQEDTQTARAAALELTDLATASDSALLQARTASVFASVLLAEGDAQAALPQLRQAWTSWQQLGVPYEAARVRVQIGLACRALGDADAANMEFEAARSVFHQLHADPDLRRVANLSRAATTQNAGGLSDRELQVIRLIAQGMTNRAIAAELVISEKTAARHVSNIFTKLGLTSRSAATAYAYEHRLL